MEITGKIDEVRRKVKDISPFYGHVYHSPWLLAVQGRLITWLKALKQACCRAEIYCMLMHPYFDHLGRFLNSVDKKIVASQLFFAHLPALRADAF